MDAVALLENLGLKVKVIGRKSEKTITNIGTSF